jgi:TldD protein
MIRPSLLAISLLLACVPRGDSTPPEPTVPAAGASGGAPKLELELARAAPVGEPSVVLVAMRAELSRAQAALASAPNKPYYFSYRVTEADTVEIVASRGALELSTRNRERVLDLEMRVGDRHFDNYHWRYRPTPGMVGNRTTGLSGSPLPIDDDPEVLAAVLWLATDAAFKSSTSQYEHAKSMQQLAAKAKDDAPDFSEEEPSRALEPMPKLEVDTKAWEGRLRKLSRAFEGHPQIIASEVRLITSAGSRTIVTSQGTEIQSGQQHARLVLSASAKADDGMDLQHADIIDVPDVSAIPDDAAITARADALVAQLEALRLAPIADPFTGPAVLEGRAAAVYFHEVFGHRVEGHRQGDESEGQTFADKVGTAVMPELIDVFDDPTIVRLDGVFLNGHYRHDDEGIPAQRALLVDEGKLAGFLLSRTPAKTFARSNGHGRAQPGADVVARQGNLVVSPRSSLSKAALDAALLEQIRKQGKPYGLRFVEINGGVTNTSRYMAQAFQVNPVVVYRVYPDGREELVRGVTLEGTPLSSLSKIVAASDRHEVFNGFCGAESGLVPVSAASPALLLSQIEIARAPAAQDRPPLLPPPASAAGGAR